jgi:uncharacterized protein YjbI with pentapeptide repeats
MASLRRWLLPLFALAAACANAQDARDPSDLVVRCPFKSLEQVNSASIVDDLQKGPVRLERVEVIGEPLDLSNQTVRSKLTLRNSVVRVPVVFRFATFQDVVDMSGTCFMQLVLLNDSTYQRYAVWQRTILQRGIDAHGLSVTPGASFHDAEFWGSASFSRARIAGGADFSWARFRGDASFMGAVIGSQAVFEAAVFSRGANFERVSIAESAFFRERPEGDVVIPAARFESWANFKGASIGGQANFSDVHFRGELRMTALKADELWFHRSQFHSGHDKDSNDVYLNDAQIGMLDFGGNLHVMTLQPGRTLNLSGLTYRRLNTPLQDMLKLFESFGPYYNRQPYKFLETQYRDIGEIKRANTVYFTRRATEGDRLSFFGEDKPPKEAQPVRWLWDRLLRYSVGYGVRWEYPLVWIGSVMLLATMLLARKEAIVRNPSPEAPQDTQPAYNSFRWGKRLGLSAWLSLNLIIPKVQLPGTDKWQISDASFENAPFTYCQLSLLLKYVAWTITTVALSVFGITDLIKD